MIDEHILLFFFLIYLPVLNRKKKVKVTEQTCIYNGREYVFCDDSWQILTYISLWFRYGFDPLRMESHVNKVTNQFQRSDVNSIYILHLLINLYFKIKIEYINCKRMNKHLSKLTNCWLQ